MNLIGILTDTPQQGQTYDTAYGASGAIDQRTVNGRDLLVCAPKAADPRATVRALKDLGATHVWLCEGVGALSPLLEMGDWIVPDDYIDGTRGQHYTYFSEKAGGYVQQAPPFDTASREALITVLTPTTARTFRRGVYVCVSNTRLETPAEAQFWMRAGGHIAGRYLSPYLTLARELEMKVAVLGVVMRMGGAPGTPLPNGWYEGVIGDALPLLDQSA
jgi:purine nucleoside phosphorylase